MSTPADVPSAARPRQPEVWIRRVRIRNFRSIAYCDVELKPLTVLVGRNGSGKSNFLDALAFIKGAAYATFDKAVGSRGGSSCLLFAGELEPRTVSVELKMGFSDGRLATYCLEIGDPRALGHYREGERLAIYRAEESNPVFEFVVRSNELTRWTSGEFDTVVFHGQRDGMARYTRDNVPPVAPERLYLAQIQFIPQAKDVYDAISGFYFYDFSPDDMRIIRPSPDDVLLCSGLNVAGILERMSQATVTERVVAYLKYIAPMLEDVQSQPIDSLSSLTFLQRVSGLAKSFRTHQMSDGTLRALGSLVAVAQQAKWGPPIRLVAIEEPETAIHPAAVAALMDAFDEATVEKQVIITTHSPDVLDRLDLEKHQLLAFEASEDGTRISPIDQASREVIKKRLSTAGDLLRTDYIETDWRDLEQQRASFATDSGVDTAK